MCNSYYCRNHKEQLQHQHHHHQQQQQHQHTHHYSSNSQNNNNIIIIIINIPLVLASSAVGNISITLGFKPWPGYIKRVFHLSLRLITFGGRFAHLAYIVNKASHKTATFIFFINIITITTTTTIIIIIIIILY